MQLDAPDIVPLVRPGQFVHIRIPHMEEALLRRPFSIYKAEHGVLQILYKGVGKGTRTMNYLGSGDTVSLIGPLGHGFPGVPAGKYPVLVAGGYGMAALYLHARALPVKGVAFFGGRSAPDILCVDEFEALGWEVRITTEDGTLGARGMVTAAIDDWWSAREEGAPVEVYACGPNSMLHAVARRAMTRGWTAWVSVDRNMGCGVGACLTCVVRVRSGEGDEWIWKRSCKEGPVFECREIIWEEK